MPVLKVIYITGFNLDKNSGRNKATREKAAALSELLPAGSFRLIYPGGSSSRLIAYFKVLIFDLKMFFTLLFTGKKTKIIQRMTFMPFTNILLRLKGVKIYYEVHTDLRDEIKHYHIGWLEKMVLHLYVYMERLNLRLAHAIIYNHPVLQEVMHPEYGKKPSIYTYNGANVKDFVL
ncbi:MAG: hypothetical protein J7497_04575, partial [Chitinophagaceae bacterium]|nr:hypothetical protein [Chitinophagaceae bacterium]